MTKPTFKKPFPGGIGVKKPGGPEARQEPDTGGLESKGSGDKWPDGRLKGGGIKNTKFPDSGGKKMELEFDKPKGGDKKPGGTRKTHYPEGGK